MGKRRTSARDDAWRAIRALSGHLEEYKKRTEEAQRQLNETVDRVDRQIGDLTNGWGHFVEALVTPGVGPALTRFGYAVGAVARPGVRRRDGESMEVDAAVLARDASGRRVVVAVEIRSRLDRGGVKEWVEALPRFFEFHPEYADRELEGMVAGIRIDEGVERLAIEEGFFVLASSGDAVALTNPDGFRPRVWRRPPPT